jgi:stage II sporulation protein GA (sporulation sigma-E factor processing peptidase)
MYADIVFIQNAVVDAALLWTAGRLAGLRPRWARLLLASAAGGLWAVAAIALPDLPLTSFWLKFPLSVGLVTLACPVRTLRQYLKALLLFYGESILAGGFAWLFGLWAAGWPQDGRIPHWPMGTVGVSAVAVSMAMACLCALYQYIFRSASREALTCRLRIRLGERCVELSGYLDTGNHLREPVSGRPVILVHPVVAARLLDIDESLNTQELLAAVSGQAGCRCVSIPYRAVGTEAGNLPGFFVDDICLTRKDGRETRADAVLALTPTPFWTGDYQALLPPGLAG